MKEEEKSDNKVAPVAQAPTLSKGQEVVKEKVENVEKVWVLIFLKILSFSKNQTIEKKG